jgi:hypothetical protein
MPEMPETPKNPLAGYAAVTRKAQGIFLKVKRIVICADLTAMSTFCASDACLQTRVFRCVSSDASDALTLPEFEA